MAKGGARPGAGRPKGTKNKLDIKDYFTEQEVRDLVQHIKDGALADPSLAKFLAEQIFGKAPQRVEMTGANGAPLFEAIALQE